MLHRTTFFPLGGSGAEGETGGKVLVAGAASTGAEDAFISDEEDEKPSDSPLDSFDSLEDDSLIFACSVDGEGRLRMFGLDSCLVSAFSAG